MSCYVGILEFCSKIRVLWQMSCFVALLEFRGDMCNSGKGKMKLSPVLVCCVSTTYRIQLTKSNQKQNIIVDCPEIVCRNLHIFSLSYPTSTVQQNLLWMLCLCLLRCYNVLLHERSSVNISFNVSAWTFLTRALW